MEGSQRNAPQPEIRNIGSPGSQRHPLWVRATVLAGDCLTLESALRAAGLVAAADAVNTSNLYANQAAALLQDLPAKDGAA